MRILLYVPVAYVAGIEGFGLFLPYIVFIAAILVVVQQMKHRPRRASRDVSLMDVGELKFEAATA
jgi:hypothetical protein